MRLTKYEKKVRSRLRGLTLQGGYVAHLAWDGLYWLSQHDVTLAELFLADALRA